MTSSEQPGELGHYEVFLSRSANEKLLDVSSRDDARRIARRLLMLEVASAMGEVYRPIYESAMPAHEVHVTFAGHYGIYYTIDEEHGAVGVEYLEDCRRDPVRKFS